MLRSESRSWPLCGLLSLWLLAACLAAPLTAQDSDHDAAAVVERLADRYDFLELSDGWLLQPKDRDADFRAIEVRDGRVAVDGTWLDESELTDQVDDDAELIFDLALGRRPAVEAPPDEESPDVPAAPSPPVDPSRSDEESLDRHAEELERVRKQLERAIERAQRGDAGREVLDRLREVQDRDDLPRDLDRLSRELERVIDRNQHRSTRRGRDSQVTLGSDLTVARGETVSEVVVISGNLNVQGQIDGDSTVVFGDALVEGFVDGSLVVVGGNIDVESGGMIDGDAIAVGGAVNTASGGQIDGEIIHLDFGELLRMGDVRVGDFYWPHFDWFDFGVFDTIGRVFRILFLAVLALLVYVLAGAKVEEVSRWARGAPWRSLFSGLAVEIAFAPAVLVLIVLLCVSIVGILLVCLVPPLAIFLLMVTFLLGYTSAVLTIGDWLARRFSLQASNRYLIILLGMAAIEIWSVFGDVVGMVPFFGWIGGLILISAWCLKFAVWTAGLGAAVLCQFSREPSPPPVGTDWELAPGPGTPPPPPAADWRDSDDDEDLEYPLLAADDLRDDEATGEGPPADKNSA